MAMSISTVYTNGVLICVVLLIIGVYFYQQQFRRSFLFSTTPLSSPQSDSESASASDFSANIAQGNADLEQNNGKVSDLTTTASYHNQRSMRQNPLFLAEDFKSVKKLLLFVGWPRSCGSFVGSILDGHPHMVIGDQYKLLRRLQAGQLDMTRESILKELYYSSWFGSVKGQRAKTEHLKGYSLTFTDLLQGKYEDHVDVIGDKFGGGVSKGFAEYSKAFVDTLRELRKTLNIPIYAIRVVRNPFDNIATMALYDYLGAKNVKMFKELAKDFDHSLNNLNSTTQLYFQLYTATEQVKALVDKAVDVHCSDLIANPREELVKLCKFLDIECSEDYISKCASHVFTEESHTSALISWPVPVLKYLKETINSISIYKRYNTSL